MNSLQMARRAFVSASVQRGPRPWIPVAVEALAVEAVAVEVVAVEVVAVAMVAAVVVVVVAEAVAVAVRRLMV